MFCKHESMTRLPRTARRRRFAHRVCEWVVFVWISAIVLGAAVPACLLVIAEDVYAHAHASTDISGSAAFHDHADNQDLSHCRAGDVPGIEADAPLPGNRLSAPRSAILTTVSVAPLEPPVPRGRAPDLSSLSLHKAVPVHALLGRLLN
jgi:hypothetical protein